MAHTGSLWGHFSFMTLFPDINLGIYTSLNGQEGSPGAMEHIAMFAGQFVQQSFKQYRKEISILVSEICQITLKIKIKKFEMHTI